MTTTRLFIEDVEVELNQQVQFLLNQQFTDISDPATIFNDWSKTVDIPFTSNNNELFGHLYSEDRLISVSNNPNDPLTGIYFDPNKKLRFRLEWNGVLLMSGYAKTNSVTKTLTSGSYNITLNGELGRVFQELDKITMDLTKLGTDESQYVLDTREKVNFLLNKETIYQAWNNEGQKHVSIDDPNIEWTDIVGFTPSNAFEENFNSKSILVVNEDLNFEIKNISETLPEVIQNIQRDSIIRNGLSPLTMKQFRSYNQLPFVWINKLFGMFTKKVETLTGYEFELDNSWFSIDNPYWYDTVLMLNNIKENRKSEECALCEMRTMPVVPGSGDTGLFNLPITVPSDPYYIGNRGFIIRDNQVHFIVENNDQDWRLKNCQFNLALVPVGIVPVPDGTTIYNKSIYYADVKILDELDDPVKTVRYAFISEDHDFTNIPQADFIITVSGSLNNNITLPFNILLNDIMNGEYHLAIDLHWDMVDYKLSNETNPNINISVVTQITFYNYTVMSNSYFNINKYWDNSVSPWKIILNYLKINRIFIEVDDISKKIKLTPYYKYFYVWDQILTQSKDWTNKLDIKKDIIIKPNRPNEKYLLFDYDDTELGLLSKYKQQYGVSYGGIRVNTNNNFNNNSKRFIEGLRPISIYSPMFVEYFRGLLNNEVKYVTPPIYLTMNTNDENKSVNIFGSMLFAQGPDTFRDIYNQTDTYYITDDDTTELYNDTYVYHAQLTNDALGTTKYTKLSPYIGDKNLWFNIPEEIYYYERTTTITATKSLYEEFWKDYISELYDPQNKQVTAYLRLTPKDYMDLKTNKFIQIKNQLYLVNKVCDYDMTNTESTKCELITIQNINNYGKTTIKFWGIEPYSREKQITEWYGDIFSDYLITGWNHENQDFTLVDVQLDGVSVPNTWTKTINFTADPNIPSLYSLTFDVAPPVPLIIPSGQQKVLTFTIKDSDGEQRTATIILRNPNIESSEVEFSNEIND